MWLIGLIGHSQTGVRRFGVHQLIGRLASEWRNILCGVRRTELFVHDLSTANLNDFWVRVKCRLNCRSGSARFIVVSDEIPSPENERDAEQKAARAAALDALHEWERKTFRQGFDAGWEACNERWRKMLQEATQQVEATAAVAPTTAQPGHDANQRIYLGDDARPAARKAADVVFDVIRSNPGIRGVDIVRATGERGPPLLERTVRTALYRMKRDGLVKNLEARWFAADAAPETGSDDEGGEDDA